MVTMKLTIPFFELSEIKEVHSFDLASNSYQVILTGIEGTSLKELVPGILMPKSYFFPSVRMRVSFCCIEKLLFILANYLGLILFFNIMCHSCKLKIF